MQRNAVMDSMRARFESRVKTRILAFGSSNTERHRPGIHWLDVFELALRKYGRFHHCINAGVCGETSYDLLGRFAEDAAFYQPHLVFLTVGGNDSFRPLPADDFKRNLLELHRRFSKIGAAVVFQTYYSPDPARCDDLTYFYKLMDIVREVAAESGAGLVDQLRRWEILRKAHTPRYLPLMADNFHLNGRGNTFMGLELARAFGLGDDLVEPASDWQEARELMTLVDALDGRRD